MRTIKLFIASALTAAILVFQVVHVNSETISLAWSPPVSTNVLNYHVYYGHTSRFDGSNWIGTYEGFQNAGGDTNLTVTGLSPFDRYFFAVTSMNKLGTESSYSNEVQGNTPGTNYVVLSMGTNFSLTITNPTDAARFFTFGASSGTNINIMTSTNLTKDWSLLISVPGPSAPLKISTFIK